MSNCYYAGAERPRLTKGHHLTEGCECKGCEPCGHSHCTVCRIAHAAEAALAARQSDPDATERVEWGVRFCDGEIESPADSDGSPASRYRAERLRQSYRDDIANPDTNHAAEDYEPMTLVSRTVRRTVTTGEWTEVGE